jgi:hypothetical protein
VLLFPRCSLSFPFFSPRHLPTLSLCSPFPFYLSLALTISLILLDAPTRCDATRRLRAHARVQACKRASDVGSTRRTCHVKCNPYTRVRRVFLSFSHSFNTINLSVGKQRSDLVAVCARKYGREKADARECVDSARSQRPTRRDASYAHARERMDAEKSTFLPFSLIARVKRDRNQSSCERERPLRRCATPTCCKCNAIGDACNVSLNYTRLHDARTSHIYIIYMYIARASKLHR